jgi:hypothetical protein
MTKMQRAGWCLLAVLLAGGGTAEAQRSVAKLTEGDVYCSGVVSRESLSYDTYLISGEQSNFQTIFAQGDYVYINRGSSGGVKIGDQFDIVRPEKNPAHIKWFESQSAALRAMGKHWIDLGRVVVESVQPNVSIAKVAFSCDFMQRGDYARPHVDRAVPEIPSFDGNRFPAPSGRQQAMVVTAKDFALASGANSVVYVNMGSAQGVKAGDFIRIFRYQGTRHDTAYQLFWTQFRMWGFGSTPVHYNWSDLPRELLGEGVVMRVSENSATVMITMSLKDIFLGDYVELK